jgi:hypothetical protein
MLKYKNGGVGKNLLKKVLNKTTRDSALILSFFL